MLIPELPSLGIHLWGILHLTIELIKSVHVYTFQGIFDDVGGTAQNFQDSGNYDKTIVI